jgi:hypothetical protein
LFFEEKLFCATTVCQQPLLYFPPPHIHSLAAAVMAGADPQREAVTPVTCRTFDRLINPESSIGGVTTRRCASHAPFVVHPVRPPAPTGCLRQPAVMLRWVWRGAAGLDGWFLAVGNTHPHGLGHRAVGQGRGAGATPFPPFPLSHSCIVLTSAFLVTRLVSVLGLSLV